MAAGLPPRGWFSLAIFRDLALLSVLKGTPEDDFVERFVVFVFSTEVSFCKASLCLSSSCSSDYTSIIIKNTKQDESWKKCYNIHLI